MFISSFAFKVQSKSRTQGITVLISVESTNGKAIHCSLTTYGCCKDSSVPALGPNYKGCFKGIFPVSNFRNVLEELVIFM